MSHSNLNWNRAVVKVGSALIAPDGKGCSTRFLLALADFIHTSMQSKKQVVIVSSGSVAAGAGLVNFDLNQPVSIPQKQALAAIGQSLVMQHWQKLFDNQCAQILLTRSDLESEKRVFNAKNTLNTLFQMNAIPIINENDSVVVDELVVGDNDNLAARVAVTCNADLLIICSDVDGLFNKNPQQHCDAELIQFVETIDETISGYAEATHNPIATGGMQTKIDAAKFAMESGIDTLIVNGRKATTFEQLKQSKKTGTLFVGKNK
ncbi:glutamate 5-kinase [Aliikangiella sp. IMCC44359]|uniref:glutamate 5-kinase n=1 Tax=Aliikangiella sp. IMCC44359 TaxID=3459125 RepID=UPI00403B1346